MENILDRSQKQLKIQANVIIENDPVVVYEDKVVTTNWTLQMKAQMTSLIIQ